MGNKTVPSAWDDDWETAADKAAEEENPPAEQPVMTKAERLAKHAEANKKLWDSAYVISQVTDEPVTHSLPQGNTRGVPLPLGQPERTASRRDHDVQAGHEGAQPQAGAADDR